MLVGPSGSKSTLRFDEHGLVARQCANGTWELSQYDDEGRLEGRLVWKRASDGALQGWSVRYEWTAEGDLVRVVDSLRGTTVYRTDAAHRLIGERTPEGQELSYDLDLADNVLSKPKPGRQGVSRVEIGSGNRLVASDTETFTYDHRDQLSTRRDRRTGATTQYVYDSFDMLVRIETRGPDGAELEPAWQYTYDALGRRTEVRRGGYRRQFYWDGDRLAAEVMPNGALRVYEYAGHGALVPLAFTDYASADAPPESGKHYTVFTDPVGQPLQIEDAKGQLVWFATRVDPYGHIEVHPASQLEYNLRWPGHYHDPETALHYNRYRYYDPGLGRYLQTDPLGYAGSPTNLYGYPANPLTDVDVLGLTHTARTGHADDGNGPQPHNGAEATPRPHGGPHSDIPLARQTPEQLQATCRHHADALAAAQEPRPERRSMNTFSVGVVEDGNGNRRLVATSNLDADASLRTSVREHMDSHGIGNEMQNPPRLERRDVPGPNGTTTRQTVDVDSGQPYDKRGRSEHHAEQRMENAPQPPRQRGDRLVAQAPSQACCPGCNSRLSQPRSDGTVPLNLIPPDRRDRGH